MGILAKPTRKANKLKQKRPRSRTLVAVHNAILDDLVYPAEIVGKRIRIRLGYAFVQVPPGQEPTDQHRAQDRDLRRRLQEADRQRGHILVPRALPVNASS